MKLFITATDTGVGKTLISTLLMKYLLERGLNPLYLKPLQTGCDSPVDRDSDSLFVYSHIPLNGALDLVKDSVCYVFPPPRAPYFAALKEGKEIDWQKCISWIQERSRGWDAVLIEGAGGLMVPITKDRLMIDLIEELDVPVLLVARPSLGTINHTLLSLEMLRSKDIPIAAVCFSLEREGLDQGFIEENKKAISMFSSLDVDIVPYYRDISSSIKFPDFFDRLFKDLISEK